MKATDLLRKDHNAVKKLFAEFGKTTGRALKKREALLGSIAQELEIHSKIEEEIFYPALRNVEGGAEMVEEALRAHEEVDQMLGDLRGMDMDGDELAAVVKELKQAVLDHATEEEKEMFKKARQLGDDELTRLGQELQERKQALTPAATTGRTKRAAKHGLRRAA